MLVSCRVLPYVTALSVYKAAARSTINWMVSADTKKTLVDGKVIYICVCGGGGHTLMPWVFNIQTVPPWVVGVSVCGAPGRAEELRQHFCQSHHLTYLTALGRVCAPYGCAGTVSVCVIDKTVLLLSVRDGQKNASTTEGNRGEASENIWYISMNQPQKEMNDLY